MTLKFAQLITPLLMSFVFSACATTVAEMEARNKDVSLQSLLGQPELTPEQKMKHETSLILNARANLTQGDIAKAARQAKQVLKSSPKNVEAQHVLGEATLAADKADLSEIVYRRLVEIDPGTQSEMGLGLSLESQGKFSAAQSHLQNVIASGVNDWRVWNSLGKIGANEKSWMDAENAFQKAIALANEAPEARENLGVLYLRTDRLAEALASFETAQNLRSTSSGMTLNHRLAHALNDNMEMAKSGADDRTVAALYNRLGESAMNSGERENAIEYFKRALAVSPAYYADAVKNLDLAKTHAP